MIHLSGIILNSSESQVPESWVRRWKQNHLGTRPSNLWTHAQDNVFLSIQGDCDLERFVHVSPQVSIICHADLLGSGNGEDFPEANRTPAAYIARLYELDGDHFATELRGWFSIILYDPKEKGIKFWTDHFGIRRLVYRKSPRGFGVASDLRLLNGFFDEVPEIDPAAIIQYMQYTCIPAPRTIYKDTMRLEPGHRHDSRSNSGPRPYWDMRYGEIGQRGLNAWEEQTYAAIEAAVGRAAKTADDSERLGCFLSGGTDSSCVSGLVGRHTGAPPSTVSIGFEHPRFNEIEYARLAARWFRADHHEYMVTAADTLNLMQQACEVYDEPFGNASIIPAYYCARTGAGIGISHMLAGDGGDELFGGNQRYASDRIFQRYHLIPGMIRRRVLEPMIEGVNGVLPIGPARLLQRYVKRATIPVPDRYFSYDFVSSVNREDLLTQSFRRELNGFDPLQTARGHFRRAGAASDLNRWLYLDIKITITDNDIRKVTAMSDLAGVCPRYPFLDPMLAEFSGTIPSSLKVRGTRLRYLFKKAMRRILPPEILAKKKHGFGLPFSIWLGEDPALREFTFDTLGSSAARQRGYFRTDLLEWLWSLYQKESRIYYGDVFWIFLMLELWHLSSRRHAVQQIHAGAESC